jgi:hypothetical protein
VVNGQDFSGIINRKIDALEIKQSVLLGVALRTLRLNSFSGV